MYIFHIYPYVYGSLHIVVIVIDSVLDSHAKKKAHYTSHCVLLKTASSSSLQKKVVSKSPLVSSEEKMSHNVTRLQSASGEKNMGRTETDYQILESSVSMQAKMRQKGIGNTPFEKEVLKSQMLLKTAMYEIMDTLNDLSDDFLQQSCKHCKARRIEKTNLLP
ncbi:PREDICTED: uncharacterized protein LOC108764087 isoform X2 [Trachymyrmex cornetzi]|uniref:uncharacterized protein LOC108764087 isoform X2 n=1 Tax=Trachymyrmex cornetzi TaxID=471704 RepID=UPI00084F7C40|nr:PREDICTED: uncharacterized protein LOC108764087 isoform X2 [Trachymyrmex cornetzi]